MVRSPTGSTQVNHSTRPRHRHTRCPRIILTIPNPRRHIVDFVINSSPPWPVVPEAWKERHFPAQQTLWSTLALVHAVASVRVVCRNWEVASKCPTISIPIPTTPIASLTPNRRQCKHIGFTTVPAITSTLTGKTVSGLFRCLVYPTRASPPLEALVVLSWKSTKQNAHNDAPTPTSSPPSNDAASHVVSSVLSIPTAPTRPSSLSPLARSATSCCATNTAQNLYAASA